MTFIRYVSRPVDLFSSIPAESLERYGITKREAQVIELLSQGYTNKEIAEKLFVSFTTVRTHVYNIYQKVGRRIA